MRYFRTFFYFLLPILLIAAIVLICFGRTLGSYFLADDFGEILYVSQIFSGNWQKLINTLTGNYMDIPTMKVYRPCLLLSIMFDYALWKTKASGYFATNIVFFIGAAMLLYLLLLELTKSWPQRRAISFALFAASLFAASPLHCESVSFMVGRVDIICAFFYLLSLWSFVRKINGNNRWLSVLGVVSFWIAILTKEMAIGLPIVLTAIALLFSTTIFKQSKNEDNHLTGKPKLNSYQNFLFALKIAYPAWLSCILYFAVRYIALGTFLGGYVGSIGSGQFNLMFEKWTDPDIIHRIMFPLNASVFSDQSIFNHLLNFVYFVGLMLALVKVLRGSIPINWLLLLVIWEFTALIPIYQLWGLGPNLEGARFLFFLTIPSAIIFPLLVYAPKSYLPLGDANVGINKKGTGNTQSSEQIFLTISTLALVGLIVLDINICAKNNIPWIHAGKQTKAILTEGQKLAQSLKAGQRVIVLGVPKEIDGAHVIYNGATFNFIMAPPFSKQNYANRFLTFDPIFFGDSDLINTQRFKQRLMSPDVNSLCVWQKNTLKFEQSDKPQPKEILADVKPFIVPLPQPSEIMFPYTPQRGRWQSANNGLVVSDCKNGFGAIIGPINLDPYNYDYMEIQAEVDPPTSGNQIKVSWQGNSFDNNQDSVSKALGRGCSRTSSKQQTYRFPLSRYWHWFSEGKLRWLRIEFPPAQSIVLKSIRLVSDSNLTPKLSPVDLSADNTGVYTFDKKGFTLKIDTQQIENCAAVRLEFSQPNYFFDNFQPSTGQGILKDILITDLPKNCFIRSNIFPVSGYYQIRAIGLKNNGESTGECSDPITVRFDSGRIK